MKNGFSLLEVMVALAILAVALLALVNFQGQSMIIYGRAEKLSLATFLAREKMADILLQLDKEQFQQGSFPEDKSDSGVFEKPHEAYKWEYQLRKVEIPAPEGSGAQQDPMIAIVHVVTDQIKEMVREVKLTISWEELGKEQSFDIVTHVSKI